jgi:hypothetical protein
MTFVPEQEQVKIRDPKKLPETLQKADFEGNMPTLIEHSELIELDAAFEERYGEVFEQEPGSRLVLAEEAFPELGEEARLEATHFLGSIAIRGEQEAAIEEDTAVHSTSLMAATQMAALGDAEARKMIQTNVATDVAERLFKAAHQTEIFMKMVGGRLVQNDRPLTDIHRNTLSQTVLIPEMMKRTVYELNNAMLFERLHRRGLLDQYDAVVFSPSSTTMTESQKKDYGLFVDTESCSIQYLTANGNDIKLETAFVAGKVSPDSERHDLKAIHALAAERGLELDTSEGSELIRQVMLIPKQEVQGVADVVRWYDDAAGGTFYGQHAPRQDYREYALKCLERGKSFGGIVEIVTEQLIKEAHTFRVPLDANLRLDELSEEFSVERAVHDASIDPAVFGETAAKHIEDARFFAERGETDRAEAALTLAKETAESGSCPLFKGSDSEGGSGSSSSNGNNNEAGGEKKWGHCPYCRAKVFVDPCAKRISCWDCTALVVNGNIISKGNGGTNKRLSEAKRNQETRDTESAKEVEEHEEPEVANDRPQPAVAAGSLALASA